MIDCLSRPRPAAGMAPYRHKADITIAPNPAPPKNACQLFAAVHMSRFWHLADMPIALRDVCVRGHSGHYACAKR
jgi:hypothetical protein